MFKRKLRALKYPAAETFNVYDDADFRNLVVWIEDKKICHCKVDTRNKLREIKAPDWYDCYRTYLKDISCYVRGSKRTEELEWLLTQAIKITYMENKKDYKNIISKNLRDPCSGLKVISPNPLDNLDFHSPEFIRGVSSLSDVLNVTEHPNHLITLEAISKLVSARLNHSAISNPFQYIVKGTPFPFLDADSGFKMKDKTVSQAAKILRLIYIHNLRGLQNQVNECIAAVQGLTANPKTDTELAPPFR